MKPSELSQKQQEEVKTDEQLDAREGTDRRYSYHPVQDAIFSPIDAAAGTRSTEEATARAKQELYNAQRKSRNRR
jgi:hypothetical protein